MTTLNLSTTNNKIAGRRNTGDRNTYDEIINESDNDIQYSTDQESTDLDSSSEQQNVFNTHDYNDHSHLSQITEQNPLRWKRKEIKQWLKQKNLYHLYGLDAISRCVNGKQLLRLNTNDFNYNEDIERLFRYFGIFISA